MPLLIIIILAASSGDDQLSLPRTLECNGGRAWLRADALRLFIRFRVRAFTALVWSAQKPTFSSGGPGCHPAASCFRVGCRKGERGCGLRLRPGIVTRPAIGSSVRGDAPKERDCGEAATGLLVLFGL